MIHLIVKPLFTVRPSDRKKSTLDLSSQINVKKKKSYLTRKPKKLYQKKNALTLPKSWKIIAKEVLNKVHSAYGSLFQNKL